MNHGGMRRSGFILSSCQRNECVLSILHRHLGAGQSSVASMQRQSASSASRSEMAAATSRTVVRGVAGSDTGGCRDSRNGWSGSVCVECFVLAKPTRADASQAQRSHLEGGWSRISFDLRFEYDLAELLAVGHARRRGESRSTAYARRVFQATTRLELTAACPVCKQ
jgi:hypothetical protein